MEIIEQIFRGLTAYANGFSWKEALEGFFLLMVVVGQHYVSKRDKRGFYFWMLSNFIAVFVMAALQRWIMVTLYVYLFYASFAGVVRWSVMERDEERGRGLTAAPVERGVGAEVRPA